MEEHKQVYIPDAVHVVIKRKAILEGITITGLVTRILTEALIPEAAELTSQAEDSRGRAGAQRALDAINRVQEKLDAVPKCEVCFRPATLPIPANGTVYCSIGCLQPGMSIPLEAFKILERLPIVATADGSTGALFYRASLFNKEPRRPSFCYRCGRAVIEGLKISVPPRHRYCHRCLRPPQWWITEYMDVTLEAGPVLTIDGLEPPPDAEKDGPVPSFVEGLRPVGAPFKESAE